MINRFKNSTLAIVGLGYVGLPLALEFQKKKDVIGFDTNKERIENLKSGIDKNLEFSKKNIKNSKRLTFTSNLEDIKSAKCFIITVPTPINKFKEPDLRFLFMATEMIGKILKKGDLVIFESTVYPGCIEEECVPILKKFSNLKYNKDFFCGYSPERINPGDKKYTISNIKKITSGSTHKIGKYVDELYNEIIKAGTHRVSSIKIAEAAKVIENTQRDLNIALINEFSILFDKLGINTKEILDAAETKWNFLPFKPGLVGGHCIGVDPYYLTFKARSVGFDPKVVLSGRKTNDDMGSYVALRLIKEMKKNNINIKKSKILIMGLTFKENCADIRNSGVKNVVDKLKRYNCKIDLYDPWADYDEIKKIYNIKINYKLKSGTYDAIVLTVAHNKFKKMSQKKIAKLGKKKCLIYDLKNLFPKNKFNLKL